MSSPPSRWCGLKCDNAVIMTKAPRVTTFAVVWIEITKSPSALASSCVTTFAVVWIEIYAAGGTTQMLDVTTFAVVWIEISIEDLTAYENASPPSRWCGLKCNTITLFCICQVFTFAIVHNEAVEI